jgi:pimeloyl-ACP methyl ester carboxylesterase
MNSTYESVTVQEKFIQANGLRMFYRECGMGAPLILLHSGTAASDEWGSLIPFFGRYFHVLAPDCRGHGNTENPDGRLSYRLMAEDTLAFSRAVDLERPVVCGWSDGGHIALEMGIRYHDAVQALVVGAAGYRLSVESLAEYREIGFEGAGQVNFAKIEQEMPEAVKYWQATHGKEQWKTLLIQLSQLWFTPLEYKARNVRGIEAPVLLVAGDRDHTFSVEDALDMYTHLCQGELAILPNADHALRETHTDLFGQIVLDYLLRHSPDILSYP